MEITTAELGATTYAAKLAPLLDAVQADPELRRWAELRGLLRDGEGGLLALSGAVLAQGKGVVIDLQRKREVKLAAGPEILVNTEASRASQGDVYRLTARATGGREKKKLRPDWQNVSRAGNGEKQYEIPPGVYEARSTPRSLSEAVYYFRVDEAPGGFVVRFLEPDELDAAVGAADAGFTGSDAQVQLAARRVPDRAAILRRIAEIEDIAQKDADWSPAAVEAIASLALIREAAPTEHRAGFWLDLVELFPSSDDRRVRLRDELIGPFTPRTERIASTVPAPYEPPGGALSVRDFLTRYGLAAPPVAAAIPDRRAHKRMTSGRPGRCACGAETAAGDEIRWATDTRRIEGCAACGMRGGQA